MSYYQPQSPSQVPPPAQQTHSLAVVSLIFGILGVVNVCPGLGPLIALITGYMAKGEIAREPYRYSGDGLAKAGIILGWMWRSWCARSAGWWPILVGCLRCWALEPILPARAAWPRCC
jgi:hypothetical protein